MTFQEAIELKEKLGTNRVTQDNLNMKVYVTPADPDDFLRYITDYRGGNFTDESSKKYSLKGEFKLCGLWTDGVNVINKDLSGGNKA